MSSIPNGITTADVRQALTDLAGGQSHPFGESTGYDLVEAGKRYPPKAVLGLAARRILGRSLGPYDFKGGAKSQCFRVLRELGFTIEPKGADIEPGDDWGEEECRELVEEYFAMLRKEAGGIAYRKADNIRALTARLSGRSKGSIEYKFQDVSGVLFELGFPFLKGYLPARNYQRRVLPDIVLEHMGSREEDIALIEQALQAVAAGVTARTSFAASEVPVPERQNSMPRPPRNQRQARRYDFARKDELNRALGRAGEAFIVERERWCLASAGRADLAEKIQWVSESQGDGVGYDIVSFEPESGEAIYIEVKTTNCGRDFPFYVSANEVRASAELGAKFRLYRVFNFSAVPRFYKVAGNLADAFDLVPRSYEARR